MVRLVLFFFFFKQKTAYEMRISDWSSDVCSSDLAAELGVSEPSISAWETDKARPKVGRVDALAQLLGVSTRELLGDGDRTKLHGLIADARTQIAAAAGARPDQIKITIEY